MTSSPLARCSSGFRFSGLGFSVRPGPGGYAKRTPQTPQRTPLTPKRTPQTSQRTPLTPKLHILPRILRPPPYALHYVYAYGLTGDLFAVDPHHHVEDALLHRCAHLPYRLV